MTTSGVLVFSTLLCTAYTTDLRFPPGFKFGVSTAAYQVEGAWNISDKSESIWDRKTHQSPESISDGSNGDVACDSYHKYKEDVQLISNLGVHFYRFSISWTRILPSGLSNYISENGVNYYNNLINELLSNGIEPMATIYHWDLPQYLQDLGGWTNPLIADWFEDYARVLYSLYSDRVKTWITINEPLIMCDEAYNSGKMAPSIKDPDRAGYLCNKNVLLAHARAWRLYDKEFKPLYHGRVLISNSVQWYEGVTEEDYELGELVNEYSSRYSHPIFSKEGGWPPAIEKFIELRSKQEGYPRSKLPAFTEEEIDLIKGTYDFYGLNHYTSRLVRRPEPGEELKPWSIGDVPELGLKLVLDPDWTVGSSGFVAINPQGFRKLLKWLKDRYGDIEILVTENGFCADHTSLDDDDRIEYYSEYLEHMLLAIKEDGVNVIGYTAWTLMDNFEWMSGYTVKFGLHAVDFNDPERKRTPRKSAHYFASVIQNHSLDVPLNPLTWRPGRMGSMPLKGKNAN